MDEIVRTKTRFSAKLPASFNSCLLCNTRCEMNLHITYLFSGNDNVIYEFSRHRLSIRQKDVIESLNKIYAYLLHVPTHIIMHVEKMRFLIFMFWQLDKFRLTRFR